MPRTLFAIRSLSGRSTLPTAVESVLYSSLLEPHGQSLHQIEAVGIFEGFTVQTNIPPLSWKISMRPHIAPNMGITALSLTYCKISVSVSELIADSFFKT